MFLRKGGTPKRWAYHTLGCPERGDLVPLPLKPPSPQWWAWHLGLLPLFPTFAPGRFCLCPSTASITKPPCGFWKRPVRFRRTLYHPPPPPIGEENSLLGQIRSLNSSGITCQDRIRQCSSLVVQGKRSEKSTMESGSNLIWVWISAKLFISWRAGGVPCTEFKQIA